MPDSLKRFFVVLMYIIFWIFVSIACISKGISIWMLAVGIGIDVFSVCLQVSKYWKSLVSKVLFSVSVLVGLVASTAPVTLIVSSGAWAYLLMLALPVTFMYLKAFLIVSLSPGKFGEGWVKDNNG